MRFARESVAVGLVAGLALAAGAASAQTGRLDGSYRTTDSQDANNYSVVELDGTIMDTIGLVTAVAPNIDLVTIAFFTPYPSTISATDQKARVRQKRYSELRFRVESGVPARNLDETVVVEKCDVDGSVNMKSGTGTTKVKCSDPAFWQGINQDSINSIKAAFESNSRVKIKQSGSDPSKGSVSITIKGDAFLD